MSATFSVTAPATHRDRHPDGHRDLQLVGRHAADPDGRAERNGGSRASAGLKVNEVQLRNSTNSTYQFIELYNSGASPVNISGWKIIYRSRTAYTDTVADTIPASTTHRRGRLLPRRRAQRRPPAYAGYNYTVIGPPAANQTFTTSLSTSSGAGRRPRAPACSIDSVGWGTGTAP